MGVSDFLSSPSPDQIEISLFGPGYGEAAAVHLGNNQWVLIDSCIDKKTTEPAALLYLRKIHAVPEQSVKLIIATHWHDDHIKGLSQCLNQCLEAKFCCPMAFGKKDFLHMVQLYETDNLMRAGSGVSEIAEVFTIIQSRFSSVVKACDNKVLLRISKSNTGYHKECIVWSLAPSDKQIDYFLNSIAGLMPSLPQTKRRAPFITPNHASVVTFIDFGEQSMLLGGDQEETNDPDTGWSVIVASRNRPNKKACIFKIPHHGSSSAHNKNVWSEMLVNEPFAILTPFNRRKKQLPSTDDVSRITSLTPNSFSTSKFSHVHTHIKRNRTVQRMVQEVVGKINTLPSTGHIRVRNGGAANPEQWQVELFHGACRLQEVH